MEKGSSSSSSLGGGADSFNGLRFGKKIYFEGVGSGEEPPRSPAKKGRTAAVQGGQPPRCQVEGCKVDLSGAKAYYCRHKVCGVHSKSPTVIVAGLEQRFCQQCSRFHQLPEFDQGKRSCRRRLAGHNERRRKPPPDPILSSRYAALSPSLYDNHIKTGGLVTDWATTTASYHQLPPWQSSSQPNLVQGSTSTRPTYTNQDCFSSALSLLSNQPLDLPANAFLADPAAASIARYSSGPSWDFKIDNSLHEMGLPHMSPYSRELGLARPGDGQDHEIEQPGGYDSSVQHMNWSL